MGADPIIKGHLDMLVLAVLREAPAHGWSVVETLRDRSGGAFDLPEGTVYPALYRLEASGLVRSSWTVTAGRRRRVYRITKAGKTELAGRREAWERFKDAVGGVLEPGATTWQTT